MAPGSTQRASGDVVDTAAAASGATGGRLPWLRHCRPEQAVQDGLAGLVVTVLQVPQSLQVVAGVFIGQPLLPQVRPTCAYDAGEEIAHVHTRS